MKVLLIGYGKMGKTIEQILLQRGHEVAHIVDRDTELQVADIPAGSVDLAIEFTEPSAAFNNITSCFRKGIPVVSGTTGWQSRKEELEQICKEYKGTFFYASNFSLGVNIFFALNKYLAHLMNRYPDYGVSMSEIHHTEKKDAPSGTAITLAEGILQEVQRLQHWQLKGEQSAEGALEIEALREPHVPGTHTVVYTSEMDTIEIKHTAHTRTSFAQGAVLAAEWVLGKKGIFGMGDLLKF